MISQKLFDVATAIDSSRLKDYMTCERFALLKHILGLTSEQVQIDLVFGAAVHKALELCPDPIAIGDAEKLMEMIERMQSVFLVEYRKEIPETDDDVYKKNPTKAKEMFLAYVMNGLKNGVKIRKILGIEIPFTIEIGGIPVHGTIDLLYEGVDGKIYIRDYKTAGAKYMFELESFMLRYQFSIYLIAVRSIIGDRRDVVIEVISLYVKGKHECTSTLIPRTIKYAESAIAEIERYINDYKRDLELVKPEIFSDKPVDQYAPFPIFPRRDTGCVQYMKLCQFASFCKDGINPMMWRDMLPTRFKRTVWDPRQKERINL